MCFSKIKEFFIRKEEPKPNPTELPHPEERPDYTKSIDNVNVAALIDSWLTKYQVPVKHRDYWQNYHIIVSKTYDNPAATSSETDEMYLRPEWANEGVLAHEFAHESYSRLNNKKKTGFQTKYDKYLTTDPYIVLLYSQNTYMKTNIVEAHAEVYRYIGEKMPRELYKYYPKLLK
jgi:hypothetical protein